MNLHPSAITISTHGWILFRQRQIDGRHLRKVFLNGFGDTTCHLLQKLRGLTHLLLHQRIERGIVQGIVHLIALHRLFQRIAHAEVDHKVASYPALLRHHPMERMEADIPQKYVSFNLLQLSIINFQFIFPSGDVLLQGALHTRLPGVDALILQRE